MKKPNFVHKKTHGALFLSLALLLASGTAPAFSQTLDDVTAGNKAVPPTLLVDATQSVQQQTGTLESELETFSRQLRQVSPESRQPRSLASLLQLGNARSVYQHFDRLFPVTSIARGTGAVSELASAPIDLEGVTLTDSSGKSVSLQDWQRSTVTDGLLVLHRGRIVYERYDAGMNTNQRHILWSATKSFTGLIAADMIQAGTLDPSAPVSHYLPELKDSAWGDATIQQTLDMTTGVEYREGALEANSGVVNYLIAAGIVSPGVVYNGPKTIVDFLKTRKKEGEHGRAFRYKTVDSEVIGLVLSKITGKDYATLVSERIWQPIGAQQDAYVLKDRTGVGLAGAGINSTLRDLARFGEMVRLEGRYNGQQILQPQTVAELRKGGDRQAFQAGENQGRDGYSYRNFWWIAHDTDGTFEAKGLHGQHVHINPAAELVVVKLSSNILPDTKATHVPDRNAFAAIAAAVRGQ